MRSLVIGSWFLAACSAGSDLPGRATGLVYDENVTCDGTDCSAPSESFDASAVVGEDASRFAPDGVYVYAWFWREDGRFAEIEIDAPDPHLAVEDPVVEYREWNGDTLVFAPRDASGEVAIEARGEDGEVSGRFSLLLEGTGAVREIHEGRFTTVPPPPGSTPGSGGNGSGGTTHDTTHDHDGTDGTVDGEVYVESGCTCVAADPPPDDGSGGCDDPGPDPDPSYDSGGGCDSGCEGDTAPSDEGSGGCSGETGGGCDSDCEGDAVAQANPAPGARGPTALGRIWSQSFPFAAVAAGLVWWRRRLRARALKS